MHHRKVAVHRDAHQEEDAPVQADVFEEESEVAVSGPLGPAGRVRRLRRQGSGFLVVVVDSQGQRDYKKQVGSRQAEHVDGRAVHGARRGAQSAQGQAVGGQPQHEDHPVGRLIEGEAVAGVHGAVGQRRECPCWHISHIPRLHVPR